MAKDKIKIEIDTPTYFSTQSDSSIDSSINELRNTQVLDTKIDIATKMSNMTLEKAANDSVENNENDDTDVTDEHDEIDGGRSRNNKRMEHENTNSYAANKNVAEGMMDIALLSANANQLRFLITYNSQASTYYISLGLIIFSLVMQVSVGIALIFKHRWRRGNKKRFARTNEFLVGGIFLVTVVNVLLAAFTTTDGQKN